MNITIREGLGTDYTRMYDYVFKLYGDLLANTASKPKYSNAPFPANYFIESLVEYSTEQKEEKASDKDIKAAECIASQLLTTDNILNCFTSETQDFLINSAYCFSNARDLNAYVVEININNLNACNEVIGKRYTNSLMKSIVGIFYNSLSALIKKSNHQIDVIAIRTGGDKMRFIVIDVNEDDLHKALTKANNDSYKIVHNTSLGKLEHFKFQGDKSRAGVGAIGAAINLSEFFSDNTNIRHLFAKGIERADMEFRDNRPLPENLIPAKSYFSHKDHTEELFNEIKIEITNIGNPSIPKLSLETEVEGEISDDLRQLLSAEHVFPDETTGLRPGHGLPSMLKGTTKPQTLAVLSIGKLLNLYSVLGTNGVNSLMKNISDAFVKHFDNTSSIQKDKTRFYAQAGGRIFMHAEQADTNKEDKTIQEDLTEALYNFITQVDEKILGIDVDHDDKFALKDFASIRDENLTPIVQVSFANNVKADGTTTDAITVLDTLDEIIRIGELKFMGNLHALGGKTIHQESKMTALNTNALNEDK